MGYGTELDCGGRFMKYSLFFVNFIIFIGGLVVAGLAIWALIDKVPYLGELVGNDLLTGAVYVILVCGIVVAFIAFFGCLGASREVKCMLLTYFIILFLLFVTMLIGGVLGYVFKAKIVNNINQEMKNSMHVYDSKKSIRDAWDVTQRSLKCCGVQGWRDWQTVGLPLPKSCCREVSPGQYFNCNTGLDSSNPSNTWKDGCYNSTESLIKDHATTLGGAGIGVACVMFIGMIFSCALFTKIK